jgi:hypothetical protein
MSDQETPKVAATLTARINLGDYNWIEFSQTVEDRVRDDLDEGKTGRALTRLTELLDAKLEAWAKEYKQNG